MIEAGYRQSQHDYSPFVKDDINSITLHVVYVDAIVITRSDLQVIDALKIFLHSRLHIKDLGSLKYFLGIEVARSTNGIYLNQRKYALELVAEAGVAGACPLDTPMEQNMKLKSHEVDVIMQHSNLSGSKDELFEDPSIHKRLVGRLLYLTITQPDICYAVQHLTQFMHSPKKSHTNAAVRVVKYIKGTPGLGIIISTDKSSTLSAYCDSD